MWSLALLAAVYSGSEHNFTVENRLPHEAHATADLEGSELANFSSDAGKLPALNNFSELSGAVRADAEDVDKCLGAQASCNEKKVSRAGENP